MTIVGRNSGQSVHGSVSLVGPAVFAEWDKRNPRQRQVREQLLRIDAKLVSVIESNEFNGRIRKTHADTQSPPTRILIYHSIFEWLLVD